MPTTLPEASRTGPPALPGWAGAEIRSCHELLRRPARAVTVPAATPGSRAAEPDSPKPTEKTPSPARTPAPMRNAAAAANPRSHLRRARSAPGSPAITDACQTKPAASRTRTAEHPCTTWLAVNTDPCVLIARPEPAGVAPGFWPLPGDAPKPPPGWAGLHNWLMTLSPALPARGLWNSSTSDFSDLMTLPWGSFRNSCVTATVFAAQSTVAPMNDSATWPVCGIHAGGLNTIFPE